MTGPLRQKLSDEGFTDSRSDNLVKGTALSRLAQAFRYGPDGLQDVAPEDATFASSDSTVIGYGVPNPYGRGLSAYEPNTSIFADYENAYNDVQQSKLEEQAQQQLEEYDFTPQSGGGGSAGRVSGTPYDDAFNQAFVTYGVPAAILAAVARAESGFNPNARSPAGAVGLMQFLPSTAAGLGINPLDPIDAINGAAQYLKQNFQRFGSWDLALAAYNAGPGAVERYGGIPPYEETQTYVARVRGYASDYGLSSFTKGATNYATGGLVDASGKTQGLVQAALNLAQRHVPYVWGGTSANGVDCSGLIYYAARAAGVENWPRYRAVDYGRMGTPVSLDQARPGDIVYYDEPGDTDHVGIYIGNGQMVQAPQSGDVVRITGVGGYTSIRRIFNDSSFTAGATPYGNQTALYNGGAFGPSGGSSSLVGTVPRPAPYGPPKVTRTIGGYTPSVF